MEFGGVFEFCGICFVECILWGAAEASLFTEAGNCARRISLPEGAAVSRKAVAVLIRSGRLAAAAKILKTLAEEFEAAQEKEQAAQLYAEAARLFETDEYSSSQRSACICKYAELLAAGAAEGSLSERARLEKAAKLFEEEGFKASQNSLLQFGAKDLFFKALLARMAATGGGEDLVDLQLCLTRYSERNSHFTSSREAKLLRQLLEALGERDEEAFTQAVQQYDAITRLDPWKVNLLLKLKPTLTGKQGPSLSAAGFGGPSEEAVVDGDGEVDLT